MAKTREPGIVYQLKVTLRDIKPPVWRRVQVKDCSLGKLREAIQAWIGRDTTCTPSTSAVSSTANRTLIG
jgi:hypothetical protein